MDIDKYIAEEQKKLQDLETGDEQAKQEGRIVGRFIREPYADSYAIYRIVKEFKDVVRIEVVEIGDAWRIPYWGDSATIKKEYAVNKLRQRDNLDELFS